MTSTNFLLPGLRVCLLFGCLLFGAFACGNDDDNSGFGSFCGGLLGNSCDRDQYCRFDDFSCGAADESGTCEEVSEVCTEEYAPVCGCDGITYGNKCFAAGAGVSLQKEGEC